MILTCPACQTRYQADAAKFPAQGRAVRCARCGHVWHQMPPEPEPEAFVEPAPPPPPPEPEPEMPRYARFVPPPERDEEPQVEEEQAPEPVAVPHVSAKRRIGLGVGWLGLALLVIVGLAAAVTFRHAIVRVWPQSASAYSAVGLKVNPSGLELTNVKYTEESVDGQTVLTVTGSLANVSDRELPVPQIRVGLIDSDKHELYHWTFAPDVMTLRPGQSTRFVTRLSSPPEGARNLNVRFAKAGE